jgi:1-acyl-sn-glycerol-3-phosphate acyltransferase
LPAGPARRPGAEDLSASDRSDRVTVSRQVVSASVRVMLNRIVAVLALRLTLILVSAVCVASAERGARVARGAVMWIARLCGVRFVEDGCAAVLGNSGSLVVVANHSSPLDIAALLFAVPEARFLAAAELFRVPLLSAAMRGMKTIPIDRRDRQTARRQLDGLVETVSSLAEFKIVIFPEGGIPSLGARFPFKAGAFELAIRTGAPVLPIAIHGSGTVLPPKGRLGVRPGTVRIQALAPISTEGLSLEDLNTVRGEAERAILTELGNGPEELH